MTEIVPAEDIEQIVGAQRHPTMHKARAVSAEQRVYILHSVACLNEYDDLRECPYSRALDRGIDPEVWIEDEAVSVAIVEGELCALGTDGFPL